MGQPSFKAFTVNDLGLAISIAAGAFKYRFDKGGNPYILHCLQVMNWVDSSDVELMIIAVLHDLIEDTKWSINDLRMLGFSERVITALECLTHWDEEPYKDYINRVATNIDAIKVKLADLRHNSDITRMKGLREKDLKRIEKYFKAFKYLSQCLEEYSSQ